MNTTATTGNVLELTDQMVFLAERATGARNLAQCVWIYDHAIDMDGLRRFHQHLQRGRLCRRIERSALPFGRHRWVTAGDSSGIQMSAPAQRSDIEAWMDDQAAEPLDPVRGPGWRLAVLPFIGGGGAVGLVVSHCLVDGMGLSQALADAASGRDCELDLPPAASRRRWQAFREDARQAARDLPAVGRALRAGAVMARRDRAATAGSKSSPRAVDRAGEPITLPTASAVIDGGEWDARAAALGGTSNALLAGLAADIARRIGRVNADGTVALAIPVSDRTSDDTRANAVSNVDVVVDPAPVATDLRSLRAAIKQALIRHNDAPDERMELLPLVPLMPKRVFRRMVSVATGGSAAVTSSNMGEADPAVNRPDGTEAAHLIIRSLYPGMNRQTIESAGGVLALASGRLNGRVSISVLAYQPGWVNSKDELRRTLAEALAAFSLPNVELP